MPFPFPHRLLTIHWVNPTQPDETGQTGLRFGDGTPPTQADVDACRVPLETLWGNPAALIPNGYKLAFLRLAAIAEDGRYVPGSFAKDFVWTTLYPGAGAATPIFPIQTACASTLVTALPRGQASKGRMFLPPLAAVLGDDYRWTTAQANARSAGLATCINSLQTALGAQAQVYSKGTVRSSVGLRAEITGVKTGIRPDVQRRRGREVAEGYGSTSAVT